MSSVAKYLIYTIFVSVIAKVGNSFYKKLPVLVFGNIVRGFYGVSAVLILLSVPTWASNNGGAFMRQGVQPQAIAMGMGYTAVAEGSDAVFWNPAVLALSQKKDLAFMGKNQYETTFLSVSGLTYATRYKMPIGITVMRASASGIDETIQNDDIGRLMKTGKQLGYDGTAILVGTGVTLNEHLALGITGKYIREHVAGYGAEGAGLDIGALYTLRDGLRFGIMARNCIRPEMKWDTPSHSVDTIPRELVLGGKWDLFGDKLTLTFDEVFREGRQVQSRGGAEYRLFPFLPVRVGLNGKDVSIGTGLEMDTFSVSFSWTKTELDVVDDVYAFGVKTRW